MLLCPILSPWRTSFSWLTYLPFSPFLQVTSPIILSPFTPLLCPPLWAHSSWDSSQNESPSRGWWKVSPHRKHFGFVFSGGLNQSVMFHRCASVMNMNRCCEMNECGAFILAECPQEDVTCNEAFYRTVRRCIPSEANQLLKLMDARIHRLRFYTILTER